MRVSPPVFSARCYAFATASRLSVRPSVTVRYRDQVGKVGIPLKLISRLVSLGCLLSACPNMMDLLSRSIMLGYAESEHPNSTPGEHTKFWPEYGWGTDKMAFSVLQLQKISETRQDRTKVTIDNYWTGVECWCYYCLDLSESDMKQITIKESLDVGKKHAASRGFLATARLVLLKVKHWRNRRTWKIYILFAITPCILKWQRVLWRQSKCFFALRYLRNHLRNHLSSVYWEER